MKDKLIPPKIAEKYKSQSQTQTVQDNDEQNEKHLIFFIKYFILHYCIDIIQLITFYSLEFVNSIISKILNWFAEGISAKIPFDHTPNFLDEDSSSSTQKW